MSVDSIFGAEKGNVTVTGTLVKGLNLKRGNLDTDMLITRFFSLEPVVRSFEFRYQINWAKILIDSA